MPDYLNPNPIYDPRQWLNMSNMPDPQSASVDSLMPQQDDPNSPEAFRKKLMMEIANRQQQAPQQDVQSIMMDLISKRRSPEAEARLQQLRAERPEDIQQRMRESLLGKPATSKLGKVGQTALEIAAGAFGVMPNTNKAALEQYKAQQAAANSEEAIDQRMTAAQANAISAMQRTKQQADAAEEKNKMALFTTLTTDAMKQKQLKLAEADEVAKTDLRKAQALKLKADTDYREKNGMLEKLLGTRNNAAAIQFIKETKGDAAAQEYAKLVQADQEVKNTSKDKPASTSSSTSPILMPDPTTGTMLNLGTKTTQTTRPAVSGGGNKNALLEAMGLSRMAETPQQAPQQAGAPQTQVVLPRQPLISPRPSVAPQAGITQAPRIEQVGAGGPETPFSQSLGPKKYRKGNSFGNGIEAYAIPNNASQVIGDNINSPKVTPTQMAEKAATVKSFAEIANLNSFMEDAAKKGQLQQLMNNPRLYINNLGGDKARQFTAAIAKLGANPDMADLQSNFEMLQSGALSRRIFSLSGKASSEKEAKRFEVTLPADTNTWDVNLSKSFYGTVMGPSVANMEDAGLLNGGTAGAISDAAQKEFEKRRKAYISQIKFIAQHGGVETPRDTETLKALKDPASFQTRVLQEAFPQHQGKDLVIDDPDTRSKIHVYIPKMANDKEYRGTKSASIEERIKNDPAYRKKLKDAGLIQED